MAKSTTDERSAIRKFLDFFPEAWAELKKVHTPSRQETVTMTIRVLGMITVFSVFLGLTDLIIGSLMRHIFNLTP
jgi:preprotein translocase SecE subunit